MRLPGRKVISGLPVVLMLFGSVGSAETLQEAWQRALEVDFGLRASMLQVDSAESAREAAKRVRYPALSALGLYLALDEAPSIDPGIPENVSVNLPGLPGILQPTFAVPPELREFEIVDDSFGQAGVMASLPVYTGGRISGSIDAADAQLTAARWRRRQTEQELKLAVAESYTNVLRAEEAVTISDQEIATVRALVQDVNNLYEQQLVAKNDVLSVKVFLAEAKQRNLQARNAVELTQAAYNRLMQRDLSTPVNLAALEPPVARLELGPLLDRAMEERPELKALQAQVETLGHAGKIIKAGLLPQVGLLGGLMYLDLDSLQDNTVAYGGVAVNWSFFDAGGTRKQAEALENRRLSTTELLAQASELIKLQVRQVWLSLEEALFRLEVAQTVLEAADENLRVTTDRYRNNLATNTEVLEAQTRRTAAFSSYNNAVYDAVYAELKLQYVSGGL